MSKPEIRALVRGTYDLQKLRIQTGLRIVANFKVKLGQEPGKPEKVLDKDAKELLEVLRLSYKRITDGMPDFPTPKKFKGDEQITTYTEMVLVKQYLDLDSAEKGHFKRIEAALMEIPIYAQYLKGVKGIGRAMAGVIISEIDIEIARYPSSIWKYAGLDVAADGRGRSRREEHLIDVEYEDKDGVMQTRQSITFNPWLKTKLIGVLGPSFMRAGAKNNPYRKIYDDYRHRLECREDLKEESNGHRHNMAIRYMIKMFLVDLYKVWRTMEGLPVHDGYQEAKLGHVHNKAA